MVKKICILKVLLKRIGYMKKLIISMLVFGNILLFATENNMNTRQLNWLNDLETLVKLDTQKEDTLAGRDMNANGIRDDVEAYVKKKYKNDSFQKSIFLKAAQKIQTIITLPKNASVKEHFILDKELLSYYTCRDYILYRQDEKNIDQEMLNKTLFKGKVLNTDERLQAYIEHKKKLPVNYADMTSEELKKEKNSCLAMYYTFEKKEAPTTVSLSSK